MKKIFVIFPFYLLISLILNTCSLDDRFLTLAKSEAELSKKLSAEIVFTQYSSDSFSEETINCSSKDILKEESNINSCGPFKQGTLNIRISFNKAPENIPELAFVQKGQKTESYKKMTSSAEKKIYKFTQKIKTSYDGDELVDGKGMVKVRVGKNYKGNANFEMEVAIVINTAALSDLPRDGSLVSPNRSSVSFTFSEKMDTSVFPEFILGLSISDEDKLALDEIGVELGSSSGEFSSIVPSNEWKNMEWINSTTIRVNELASTLGILPENVALKILLKGAKTKSSKTIAASFHEFYSGANNIVYQPPHFTDINNQHKNNSNISGNYYEMYKADENISISFGKDFFSGQPYTIDGKISIIKDTYTNLLWTQCSMGRTNGASSCDTGENFLLLMSDAVVACDTLNTANDNNGFIALQKWRLPTARELNTLLDLSTLPQTIFFDNTNGFANVEPASHWSITLTLDYKIVNPDENLFSDGVAIEPKFYTVDYGLGLNQMKSFVAVGPVLCVNDTLISEQEKKDRQKKYTQITDASNGKKLFKDEATSLYWHECTYGSSENEEDNPCFSSIAIGGVPKELADIWCSPSGIGLIDGKTPRLPTIYELDSLEDYNPVGKTNYINGTTNDSFYWSDTNLPGISDVFFVYTFAKGINQYVSSAPSNTGNVRCVFE